MRERVWGGYHSAVMTSGGGPGVAGISIPLVSIQHLGGEGGVKFLVELGKRGGQTKAREAGSRHRQVTQGHVKDPSRGA